jgi:Carboxypeptidase regulatory-like domain
MKKLAAVGALATLALGCGSAGGGTSTGLHGYVKRGPTMPVCRVGVPCTEPARGVKLMFSRSGKVAATAITNKKGWYRVTLRPGRYTVRTNKRGYEATPQPRTAIVSTSTVKRRDFLLDTGIR